MSTSPLAISRVQRKVLGLKFGMTDRAVAPLEQPDTLAPAGSVPLFWTTPQQTAMPGAGAGAINILNQTVPSGQLAEVRLLALVFLGGNQFDMSGNIIWRFLVNGAPLKGLGTQVSQIGSFQQPQPVWVSFTENDQVTVTVEVPAAANPIPVGLTACRMIGWTVAIREDKPSGGVQ